ncbi:MAG: NTPase KAP [Candidatus Atribacteria bacterium]|nr:NTPase KAP [Candidatus Atribacteria bacterium]
MTIAGDNPIRRLEDDALGRASVAQSFAQQALALDTTEGAVVGVLGAWGSGKTSFINIARFEFKRVGVPVLDFNPWMFSGTEQLVQTFFVQVAAQLKLRHDLAKVGKDIENYGELLSCGALLPEVGPWIEGVSAVVRMLGKVFQRSKKDVYGIRDKIEKALAIYNKPIIVVLDDIDRLSTAEIRDIFKLIRLVASFPNIIYIVAFDRDRVEAALTESGFPGRNYLEKILQVSVDLPAVANDVLIRQIYVAIEDAFSDIEKPGPFDKQVWPDILMEIIWPLIRNMRDIRRYAAAIHGTVKALDGQIALADVLALEAVRVFSPDVFGLLHEAFEGLTNVAGDLFPGREDPRLKAQIDGLIGIAKSHNSVVRAMIERLFPAALRHIGGSSYGRDWTSRWFRERRVAHKEILRLYLERVAGEDLQTLVDAERARKYLGQRETLDGFLRSVEPARLQDVVASLEAYEEEFDPKEVVPATIVLLNLFPDVPERKRGMFELETRTVIARTAYRLIRTLRDAATIEAAVRGILPELTSLSAKFELVRIVGYREGVGHKLVLENAATEFETALRTELRDASVDRLSKEYDLLSILLTAKRQADPSEGLFKLADEPKLTLAILRSAQRETLSQADGSRAVKRSTRLAWEALLELYGDEATLRMRVENLKLTRPEGADDLLKLAEKYLEGWRPGRSVDSEE